MHPIPAVELDEGVSSDCDVCLYGLIWYTEVNYAVDMVSSAALAVGMQGLCLA
jgi:hypothetical protein